ncbi:hypothetical protein ACMD2_18999 [Ananas comosus]|uniref:Uncharacterized protein n=1 Tax=Ananas comosus TaxID=4615 RepID=A0A199W8G3_ANACO|nr:hypothetical protein ACMD2_18999 [Ananas comosus]
MKLFKERDTANGNMHTESLPLSLVTSKDTLAQNQLTPELRPLLTAILAKKVILNFCGIKFKRRSDNLLV